MRNQAGNSDGFSIKIPASRQPSRRQLRPCASGQPRQGFWLAERFAKRVAI